MSELFNCPNCGKTVYGGGYYVEPPKELKKSIKRLLFEEMTGIEKKDGKTSHYYFCCPACGAEYYEKLLNGNHEKINGNQNTINEKADKKKEKIENSKVQSDESLTKISKLCLTAGYLGIHRFAVGKFVSGITMPVLLIMGIAMAITNNDVSMLSISAVDIVWWLFDLAVIKSKKFTDKYGHTIKEN